jgi:hypothetical protein
MTVRMCLYDLPKNEASVPDGYMPGPFSCTWGCVYMIFPNVWQLFRTLWQYSPILCTGPNSNVLAPKSEFYL